MPKFRSCAEDLASMSRNGTIPPKYMWNGSYPGLSSQTAVLINLEGCQSICGTGNQYFHWDISSAIPTTWVLPVIGLLLQAPYVSNEFWQTLRALARWIGNPFSSLSYILWNMQVTGKCALMVDMATKYEEIPREGSQFAQIRDSMYILSVMNQCMLDAGSFGRFE